MDEQRFDQLSRRFSALGSRRQVIKAIAGAIAGVAAGVHASSAQECTPHFAPCGGDDQCCAGAVCEYGVCMPGCRIEGTFANAWTSPPGDNCNQCLPDLSTEQWSPVNEGMSCWSGDPNAGATFCQSGECLANVNTTCPPPPPCHTDELIDSSTCTYAIAAEGTLCGNGSMCHGGFYQPADMCDAAGFCIGGGSQTVNCAPYQCGVDACLTSCSSDADCVSPAQCIDTICTIICSIECPPGFVLDEGACACIPPVCPADASYLHPCGANGACDCEVTIEGVIACLDTTTFIDCVPCQSTDDCPFGEVCAADPASVCSDPHCHPACTTL